MELKFITSNANETIELGKKIGLLLKAKDVILLVGDLSAGKTTLTKGIGQSLGVKRVINSPTFTIVKEYEGTSLKLFHLDLYRLDGIGSDFDLEEYFDQNAVVVMEWPHQIEELIPSEYLEIDLRLLDEGKRQITLKAYGKRYERLLGEIKNV